MSLFSLHPLDFPPIRPSDQAKMRPGIQAQMDLDDRHHTPAYLKARKQLEEDSPIPLLKGFLRDSIFTQKYFWFWGVASLIFDTAITFAIVATVKCKSRRLR